MQNFAFQMAIHALNFKRDHFRLRQTLTYNGRYD